MSWASKRRLRVASRGHAVVCRRSHALLMVDFVFEESRHRRGRRRRSFLAAVYFSARRSSGGPLGRYAARYMQMVQRVCNRDMDFFPTVLAMCVYSRASKVYARDVGIMSLLH